MTNSTGREFLKNSKPQFLSKSDQNTGSIQQPPLELEYDKSIPQIDLPDPKKLEMGTFDLTKTIEQRQSRRRYTNDALSLEELSYLLWTTQGIKEVLPQATLRTVPSAGARHAFETYLLINRVDGVNPGLYRFLAFEHKLICLTEDPEIADKITKAGLEQNHIKQSAVTFIWAAVTYRMTWRYVERGYRYLFIDAGHVCQNLYLASEAIGGGICAIAAFDDDEMNEILDFDGKNIFTIYMASMGKV
jgi:SagB-type dehydrogenase family enzyme